MKMASFKLTSLVLFIAVFVLHRSVSAFNETAAEIKTGNIQSRKLKCPFKLLPRKVEGFLGTFF